jgi:tetrahydromethanopterin S-methyltransferase subunit F
MFVVCCLRDQKMSAGLIAGLADISVFQVLAVLLRGIPSMIFIQ